MREFRGHRSGEKYIYNPPIEYITSSGKEEGDGKERGATCSGAVGEPASYTSVGSDSHSVLRWQRYPTRREDEMPPAGCTLILQSAVDSCATGLAALLSRFLLAVVGLWLLLVRGHGGDWLVIYWPMFDWGNELKLAGPRGTCHAHSHEDSSLHENRWWLEAAASKNLRITHSGAATTQLQLPRSRWKLERTRQEGGGLQNEERRGNSPSLPWYQ